MTAKELYEKAKMLMVDKVTSTAYQPYYVEHINVLLAELFDENNALRESAKKEKLTEIPQINKGDDGLLYEPQMLLNVMPKGLAARFMLDDQPEKYSVYQSDYLNARSAIMPIILEEWD